MSQEHPKKPRGNAEVFLFITILSLVCALVLSILASALEEPQETAKELDRSKQMMIAAKIFSHDGYFLVKNEAGEHVPAKFTEGGVLVPNEETVEATQQEILEVYKKRLVPMLVNSKGVLETFSTAGINQNSYIALNKKTGYYKQPLKLVYEILPNDPEDTAPIGYVIPVNGFGLWDAIYGYMAIATDGDTVIGISWYEQKETPGLGANIAEPQWQNLFPGKKIFQENASGETNFKTSPVGITVVKGKVSETLGDVPKAKSAVDGMAGATLTGNGVTEAYKQVLSAYRPFFINIHQKYEGTKG